MSYKIEYIEERELPRLGWIAVLDPQKKALRIIHGSHVECRDAWMVEGVWDGGFQKGNFHQTEVFFGSGMRIGNDNVCFVTSCALTDRILYCEDRNRLIFSNSLLLMLGFTGAKLDEDHDYRDEAMSVTLNGVSSYDRTFRVVHPRIKNFYQVFYENIVVRDGKIDFEFKPRKKTAINSYETYYRLLLETVTRLKTNWDGRQRKVPVRPYATVSSGYDSTAVSALVKKIGVSECFSGNRLDGLLFKGKNENGTKIAKALGYTVNELNSKRSAISQDERYFLSTNYPKHSNSVWSEISLHSMAKTIEDRNQPAVIFTGYNGDAMWDAHLKEEYQGSDLKGHGTISGLNLTEIRLKAGFFTVPIPYLYARDIKAVAAISRSNEMENWKLGTDYDRPIARRMAEEAGVSRHLFGVKKQHITTTYLWPINKENRKRFFSYLKKKKGISSLYIIAYYFQKKLVCDLLKKSNFFGKNIDFYDIMRKWATDELQHEFSLKLKKHRLP